MAHARLFFEDLEPATFNFEPPISNRPENTPFKDLLGDDPMIKEYLCYILLDFVAADNQLEDVPLSYAIHWSRKLGLENTFSDLAMKELRISKKQFAKISGQVETTLSTLVSVE